MVTKIIVRSKFNRKKHTFWGSIQTRAGYKYQNIEYSEIPYRKNVDYIENGTVFDIKKKFCISIIPKYQKILSFLHIYIYIFSVFRNYYRYTDSYVY